MHRIETAVVGGGAAGIMTAISAATRGERVLLLEANAQLGRKVLISGNGRCNLTNQDAHAASHYHGTHPGFAGPALAQFPLQQTLRFFVDLGLEVREERRGRLFPLSDQAQAVLDVLEDRMRLLGVAIATGARIAHLSSGDGFLLEAADGRKWQAARVVLASGGLSVPKLGADRSGIGLAEGLGHTSTDLYPGLVALVSPERCVHQMQGVKVRAQVQAPLGRNTWATDTDDLLFTAYGVSGWAVLNLSARVVPLLADGPVDLRVNLFPGKTAEQLSEALKLRWQTNPHRSLELSFTGLLHSKLIRPLLERAGLSPEQRAANLTKAQRWQLAQFLVSWPIRVVEPRSFEYAEITIGGINTTEVDPETLESRLVPGLYLVGEMLDVHGDLGGFNLQWAWSSGWVAGQRRGS
jgi:predicted Rossmann fold flavoprotein